MIYLRLCYEFFKTGLFAVGGGMATLPFLYDLSDKTGWFTHSELTNMIAVSESTPGPIGVNTATYVGFAEKGVPGALVATLGLITPSVIVILLIAMFLKAFRSSRLVESAFYGLRPASTGLIAAAGIPVLLTSMLWVDALSEIKEFTVDLIKWPGVILAVVIYLFSNHVKATKKLHPILFIAFSAVVGVVFRFAGA